MTVVPGVETAGDARREPLEVAPCGKLVGWSLPLAEGLSEDQPRYPWAAVLPCEGAKVAALALESLLLECPPTEVDLVHQRQSDVWPLVQGQSAESPCPNDRYSNMIL